MNAAVVTVLLKPNGILKLQEERRASEAAVSGKDAFTVHPSGFGKSSVQHNDATALHVAVKFQAEPHLSQLVVKSLTG